MITDVVVIQVKVLTLIYVWWINEEQRVTVQFIADVFRELNTLLIVEPNPPVIPLDATYAL